MSSDIMAAWGASKSETESLKVAAWDSSDAAAKDDACEPDTQVGTYAEGVNLAIERFFGEDSQLQFAIVLNTFVKVASSLSSLSLSISLSLSLSLCVSLFLSSQPLNHSTLQPLQPVNPSALQLFKSSTIQPFNPSTL